MSSVRIYSSTDFKEIEGTSEDMNHFYRLLFKLNEATNLLAKAETIDDLYKTAVEVTTDLLDIDRMGILLTDDQQKSYTGTWGSNERGQVRPEHDYSSPVSQEFSDVISKIESKDKVCLWDNHPLYKFDEENGNIVVIGLGWSVNVAIWQDDLLIGWIACDNLINHRPFKAYYSHILRLLTASLCECRERLITHQKITELNESLEIKVKQRTRQLAQVQHALELANNDLEQRISNRTQTLKLKNNQLEIAVKKLSSTENQLSIVKAHGTLKDLVVGLAHEAKFPLEIANAQAKALPTLLDSLSQAMTEADQNKIDMALQQCTSLTDTLQASIDDAHSISLEFERLSTIKVESIPAQEVVLNDWLDHMLKMAARIEPNILALNIDIKFNTPIKTAILHSEVLIQIFKELLLNIFIHAKKARGSRVIININIANGELFATIEDNGPGIEKRLQRTIFNPFISTARTLGHKGLGLNVAFNLTYFLLKGNLSYFDSKLGGAGFLVKCPIQLSPKTIEEQQEKNKHPFHIERTWGK